MIYDGDYYVGSDLNGDSLSHHGVPNQKWGVRHGPPYPVQRGREVKYSVGKMTEKTKAGLQKAGKITVSGAKAVKSKVSSSFKKWKEGKKADLVVKETDSKLMKNWQKKQLRISDMSNEELRARAERRKLEETYKHALRGDFSEAKGWYAAAKQARSKTGKAAAAKILKTFGDAAVEGIAKGLANKLQYSMVKRAKGRVDRREARKDALAEVMRDAAKERAKNRAAQKAESRQRQQELNSFQQALRDEDNFQRYAQSFYSQRALPSGRNDMDDYWNRYGPSV